MNLAVLEEWIEQMEIPTGVRLHFLAVRDLLNWLQVGHLDVSMSRSPRCLYASLFHLSPSFPSLLKRFRP